MTTIRPLDARYYEFTLSYESGEPFDVAAFDKILFNIGPLCKEWTPGTVGDVSYMEDGKFAVFLNQDDTAQITSPPACQAMLYYGGKLVTQTNIPLMNLLPTTFRGNKEV